jgi:hypothetical protein
MSSFQFNNTSARSASSVIGLREASVLQRVIFCLTTERVTLTSNDSKSTSSHLSPSNSPTLRPLDTSRNTAGRACWHLGFDLSICPLEDCARNSVECDGA